MIRRSSLLNRCPLERKRRQKLVRVRKLAIEDGAINIVHQQMEIRTVNYGSLKMKRKSTYCAVDRRNKKIKRRGNWIPFDLTK